MATQRWPEAWLFTDERMGDRLAIAMERAARAGGGILVRHHSRTRDERREIALHAQALGAVLGISRDVELAASLGTALVHNPTSDPRGLPSSFSVHDEQQARAAALKSPAFVFVSPVYPTRSHPQAPVLGEAEATRLATICACPAYALGGVDAMRWPRLQALGFAGWAGIDAWLRT